MSRYLTPASRIIEFMDVWDGKDPGKGSQASDKLDGVYAKATSKGLVTKSGKPIMAPHVAKRLRRHFRKNPDAALEGELWRKGKGIEEIAGKVRSGDTKDLRLHIFPKAGEKRPWSIGAVRRVKGKNVATAADVEKVMAKALKRGHEGVVVRGPDGVARKKKPREDAEWEVAQPSSGQRGVMVLKNGTDTFKAQARKGIAAKAGDRVQVSYSGKTAKGKPKAAVVERIRNNNDFQSSLTNMNQTMHHFESPARKLLGKSLLAPPSNIIDFKTGEAPASVRRRETIEEEIARDRRTLKRIGIGAAVAGSAAALLTGAGKRLDPSRVHARKMKKALKSGHITAGEAAKGRLGFESPAQSMGLFEFKERDNLEKARDVAIIGGTAATGAGAVVAARQARKVGKQVGVASDAVIETAKKVQKEVTPQRVAHEGLSLVKGKTKKVMKDHFPTFIRAGRLMRRRVFSTPASSMGLFELAASATDYKVRDSDRRFVDHWDVASGLKKGYDRQGKQVNVGMGDAAVVKSLYRKAGKVNKWGTRGGSLVRDVGDVVTGKPRRRDASGRKKPREWEKSWAKDAAKKSALVAGGIAYGIGLRRSPSFRKRHNAVVSAARRKVKDVQDSISNFSSPASRMGIPLVEFAKKDESKAKRAALVGAAAGGAAGAAAGAGSGVFSKHGDDYLDRVSKRQVKHQGDLLVLNPPKSPPFKSQGRFTHSEKLARAEHESLKRLKRGMRRRAAGGGLAGALLAGGLAYAAAKKSDSKKKRFCTPASEVLVELGADDVIELDAIAKEAGWDIRDPRGRSARVFAPGSRRRKRREKKWHEEVDNERKLWKGGVVAAGLAGGAAGVLIGTKLKPRLPGNLAKKIVYKK